MKSKKKVMGVLMVIFEKPCWALVFLISLKGTFVIIVWENLFYIIYFEIFFHKKVFFNNHYCLEFDKYLLILFI